METNKKITAAQLGVLMFVSRISAVITAQQSFDGKTSVWGLMLPLLVSIVIFTTVLIPVLICGSFERQQKADNIFTARSGRAFLILFSVYECTAILYRTFSFCIEYAPDISGIVITIIIFAAALYAAVKGLEAAVRFSFLVFIWILAGSIVIMTGLFPLLDLQSLNMNAKGISMSDGIAEVISGAGEIILLICYLSRTKGRTLRPVMMWNIFQSLFLVFMLILISGSMGIYLIGTTFPFYHITDGTRTLQRLHPVFISIVISSAVCQLCGYMLILRDSLCRIRSSSKAFYITVSVIASGAVFLSLNKNIGDMLFDKKLMMIIIFAAVIFLPFIRLIGIMIKNKSISKRMLAGMLTVMIVFMSGCSDIPLNQRLIIQGIGIDKSDDGIMLTMLTLDTEAENSENSIKIIKGHGKDVEDAVSSTEASTGKRCLLSQCLFIMMNRDAASESSETLSYFCNNKEIMKTSNIIVSSEDSEGLLTDAVKRFGMHSEDINMVVNSSADKRKTEGCTLFDYIVYTKGEDRKLYFPLLEIDTSTERLTKTGTIIAQS